MATHDIGSRFFWQSIRIFHRPAPLVTFGKTTMTEPPFKKARPLIIRVPFTTHAVALGLWEETGWDEEEALYNALSGWGFDPFEEDKVHAPRAYDTHRVREAVAAQGLDISDEWRILSNLGATE